MLSGVEKIAVLKELVNTPILTQRRSFERFTVAARENLFCNIKLWLLCHCVIIPAALFKLLENSYEEYQRYCHLTFLEINRISQNKLL